MRSRFEVAGAATLLLVSLADRAAACPVCFATVEEKVLDTYYFSTVMLSLLPFGLAGILGTIGWMLLREQRRRAEPPSVEQQR